MSKLYLFHPAKEHLRLGHSINSALGVGADEAAARVAVLEADKPRGFIDPSKFSDWEAVEIADGTITLPEGAEAQFLGRVYAPAMPMAGA